MFDNYAEIYDAFYHDKDYESETEILKIFFEEFTGKNFDFQELLEIGCGTGSFTKILANYTKNIVGMDISSKMLSIAAKKNIKNASYKVLEDFLRFDFKSKFDSTFALFHVTSYMNDAQLKEFFDYSWSSLKPTGHLVFDFWDLDEVLNDPPQLTTKGASFMNRHILRIANPEVNKDFTSIKITMNFYESCSTGLDLIFSETHTIYPRKKQHMIELMGNRFDLKIDIPPTSNVEAARNSYGRTLIASKM
jgi:SAM-dependent methyltransferase